MKTFSVFVPIGCFILFLPSLSLAKPPGQKKFCESYPAAPTCASGQVACTNCHTAAPALNVFGTALTKQLAPGVARPLSDEVYAASLPAALKSIDGVDSDGDGASNGDEIRFGADPSDAQSKPLAQACDSTAAAASDWNVCGYDPAYVFRKVLLDFCGRSATFEERTAFKASTDTKKTIHQTLDTCLKSEFWKGRDGVVWNIASPKIRPIQSIKAGKGAGPIPLADYFNDYALFVYAHTEDRDARDVLRAQYLVEASDTAPTVYTPFDRTPLQDYEARDRGFESTDKPNRAGLLSSIWFRTINTMFTSVPRTTAAQAYRSYLGLDISLQEGLRAGNAAEPVDYDRKGVRATGCIACHQTLDPLAYPFSRYEGIDTDELSYNTDPKVMGYFTAYRPDRMVRFAPIEGQALLSVPEAGVILGKPVKNLVEWAKVAADSDEFAQKTMLDYWRVLFGRDPSASETQTFTKLWKKFRSDNAYQISKSMHDFIETEAYGVP
jgi:hypothetical protein